MILQVVSSINLPCDFILPLVCPGAPLEKITLATDADLHDAFEMLDEALRSSCCTYVSTRDVSADLVLKRKYIFVFSSRVHFNFCHVCSYKLLFSATSVNEMYKRNGM